MRTGDLLHGFRVERIRPIEEVDGELFEMRHLKTGASLCYLKRPDVNKTFYVAFETLPEDDTGVFHILEHSVLCGSELYHVREPFVELLKSSLNTFLNAITYADKTVYPVASRNDKDFFHLMKVYLDAVFRPDIHRNPSIFHQEGWHVHLEEGKEPAYQGVVFNEMKGALSTPDRLVWQQMMRVLFPDSPYGYESGGDPKAIPNLTYEQFIRSYERFYHPSNARFFLDGEVQVDEALRMINDEYLDGFQARSLDFTLAMQSAVPASESTVRYAIAPGEDQANKCYYAMGRVMCTWQEKEKRKAMEALCDYLIGSNEAPLKKALLRKGLCQDVQMMVDDGAQPVLMLLAINTDEAKLDELRQTIRDVAREQCAHGLDRADMEATLNRMEFKAREWREPSGLRMGITMLESWLYGGDPAMYLQTSGVFGGLREKLDGSYYPELLREMLLDEEHLCVVKALPYDTLTEQLQHEEKVRLDQLVASWDDAARARAEQEMQALTTWQQTPDSEEALASLPRLTLADVAAKPEELPCDVTRAGGATLVRSESRASGITYLNLIFRLTDLTLDQLPYAGMLASLLGSMATSKRSAAALKQQVKSCLGKLTFSAESISDSRDSSRTMPVMTVRCSVLDERVDDAVRLITEILTSTVLDDRDTLRDLMQQRDLYLRQTMTSAGHYMGMLRAASHESAHGAANDAMVGYGQYRVLHAITGAFDEKAEELLVTLRALYTKVFTVSRLTLGVSGVMSDQQMKTLLSALPQGTEVPEAVCYPPDGPVKEGIVIPSNVSYAQIVSNACRHGHSLNGHHVVLASILSYQYLWSVVRVQGGAYGVGLNALLPGMLAYYSYRDPTPGRTLEMYRAASGFVRDFAASGAALDQMIIGSVAGTDPLLSASDRAEKIIRNVISGDTYERQCEVRSQMLATTMDDLIACCDELDLIAEKGSVCVIGSADALSKAGDDLTLLEL